MPFTLSHVAAVLPFAATPRMRRWFDPAALAIGATIPDLPLFWPGPLTYAQSHDVVLGPIVVDLVLGLVVFVSWSVALRRHMSDLAPALLQQRLPADRPLRAIQWAPVAASIVVGAYTHVLWDAFTHTDRLASDWIPALGEMLGPLPVYKWLQYGSGVGGLAVLAGWAIFWWRRNPPRPVGATPSPTFRRLSWALVGAATAAGVLATVIAGSVAGLTLERLVFQAVTRGVAVATLTLIGCCACWWVVGWPRHRSS